MSNDPASYRLTKNPYAATDDPSDSAEFIAEARQRLADLAATPSSPRLPVLQVGDVVAWSESAQFEAFGVVEEIIKGQSLVRVRLLDLQEDGRLAVMTPPQKKTLDLTRADLRVRKSNRTIAGTGGEKDTATGMDFSEGDDEDFVMAFAAMRGEAPAEYRPPWKRERRRQEAEERERRADLALDAWLAEEDGEE